MLFKFSKKYAILFSVLASLSLIITSCAGSKSESNDEEAKQSKTITEVKSNAKASAKVTVEGTKFLVDGKEIWFNGVNTPWDNWNDFGGDFDADFWDSHFADLRSIGVNSNRIWINCNSMVGIKLKTTGEVNEVTKQHWADLDKLFELAKKHKIYLMPTLLSFDHFKDSNSYYDRWRAMISNETSTKSFIDSYVIPFVKRYGSNDYLWGIDLMNEPDWVIENEECGKIGWDVMSLFFARCASAIHTNSDALVTVGLGMVKYNSDKYEGNYISDKYLKKLAGENAYLDFYSTHYYFWQNKYMGFPFEMTPEKFGLGKDKPCVIGETAANGDGSGRTIKKEYESAYKNGWNGVLAWTSNSVDACGGFDDVKTASQSIEKLAEKKVFPLGK